MTKEELGHLGATASARIGAVCLSAGGCVAYYPTHVPFHHRSQWLGNRDPFGELVRGCRKLGMVVIARTDPHATYDDVQRAHPDWIAVDSKGDKRRHASDADFWLTCALGPYNFEFMTAVTEEIVTLYQVDGIFSKDDPNGGPCIDNASGIRGDIRPESRVDGGGRALTTLSRDEIERASNNDTDHEDR